MMANASDFGFIEWLQSELDARDWKQSDLARRSGIGTGYLSQIMNGVRNPGAPTLRSIARAFGIRDVEVLRRAGLADPETSRDEPRAKDLLHDFNELSDEDQVKAQEYIKGLKLLRGQQARRKKTTDES